ncbi:MAG: SDR family oxidoreductase [Polyangiaceae bacterium]
MSQPPFFAPGIFQDQVALVTGGGSGIGLDAARQMGQLGAKIAIVGRTPEKLEAGKASLEADGIEVLTHPCDIRDAEAVGAMVDAVMSRFKRIDVLINNAGGQFPSPAEMLSPRGWEAVIRNNLNGTFFVTSAVAQKAMIPAHRGRIVNVIANVFRGFPGMAHTGAARAGVENMTKSLAVEWARHGIGVNAVAPGTIRSSGTNQYGEELLEIARRATPMKRLGTPEETARVIVFLASHFNSYVTGSTYYIDGGASLWGDIWQIEDAPAAGPS